MSVVKLKRVDQVSLQTATWEINGLLYEKASFVLWLFVSFV